MCAKGGKWTPLIWMHMYSPMLPWWNVCIHSCCCYSDTHMCVSSVSAWESERVCKGATEKLEKPTQDTVTSTNTAFPQPRSEDVWLQEAEEGANRTVQEKKKRLAGDPLTSLPRWMEERQEKIETPLGIRVLGRQQNPLQFHAQPSEGAVMKAACAHNKWIDPPQT